MDIKEHIEAGHYPRDDKGRALVPDREGNTAIILATDLGGIIALMKNGGTRVWSDAGDYCHGSAKGPRDLLPPPPRKVKVTAYARVATSGDVRQFTRLLDSLRIPTAPAVGHDDVIVELTGEYDEPWS